MKKSIIVAGAVLGTLFAGLLVIAGFPVEARPAVKPDPARNYDDAVKRLDALANRDLALLNPLCQDRRWLHGRTVARAVVLVHGITNCPKQYDVLGQMLADTGPNVIAVRLPYHGYANRDTDAHAALTADDLARSVGEAIDIARGIGDEVDVVGISGGGIAAVWAGQFRADVRRIVTIAPVFGPKFIPSPLTVPALRLMIRLPNFQVVIPDAYPYAYANNSLRSIGQTMLLGQEVLDAAAKAKPAAQTVAVLDNDADNAVSNDLTNLLIERWRSQGSDVRVVTIPASAGLGHDIIDPTSGIQPEKSIYPYVLQLLDLPAPK